MKVIVATSALLVSAAGVWANSCDDLNKLFDDGFPKVAVQIDKASQSTSAKDLAGALNQVADTLGAYRQKFTSIVADSQKKSNSSSSGLDDCMSAIHRFHVFLKQLQAGVDELKAIFPKFVSDPDVTAALNGLASARATNIPEIYWSVGDSDLTVDHLQQILASNRSIRLSSAAHDRIIDSRKIVEQLAEGAGALYGINTGFGVLAHQRIPRSDLEQLQENLILSHAVGVGDEVPSEIVRLMLLLKAQGLALGYSGTRVELIEYLIRFFNEEFTPIIFTKGSLGASGDLAPLAHLTLPALGFGEGDFKGSRIPAKDPLQSRVLEPLRLNANDSLALTNAPQSITPSAFHSF